MWWIWIIVAGLIGQMVIVVVLGRRLWRRAVALANDVASLGSQVDRVLSLIDKVGESEPSGQSGDRSLSTAHRSSA